MIYRTAIISVLLLSYQALLNAQGGTWVWVNGSDSSFSLPSYGTKGVPAASNTPGGLYQAAQFADKQGNLWIYGGIAHGSEIQYGSNDLWKYDRTTNMWTWVNSETPSYGVKGVPSTVNWPIGRGWGCATWIDTSGNFWMFGGVNGIGEGMNDLWKYDVAANEWTFMAGDTTSSPAGSYGIFQLPSPTNLPPPRYEANTAWTDNNNNLWLFGGYDDLGNFNDMWRYSIATGEWTWMSGDTGTGLMGSAGKLGVESASNVPTPRASYTHWVGTQNDLYLWGGIDNDFTNTTSDVWRYDLNTNYWTWIAGDTASYFPGSYRYQCSGDSVNSPRPRYEHRSAQLSSCTPILLTFGGITSNDPPDGKFNDLWAFNPQTLHWTWLSGPDTVNSVGNYGTKGVPASSNMLPARNGCCFWADSSGVLWLFGGNFDQPYNDMWKFIPDSDCLLAGNTSLAYQLSSQTICPGGSAVLSVSGVQTIQVSPSGTVNWLDSVHAKLQPDSTTTYSISGQADCGGNYSSSFTIQVVPQPDIIYQLSDSTICAGDSDLLTLAPGQIVNISPMASVVWRDSLHALLFPDSTTSYQLSGYTSCGNSDTMSFTIPVVNANIPVPLTANKTWICNAQDTVFVCATPGFTSYYWNNNLEGSCTYFTEAGIYYLQVYDYDCPSGLTKFVVTNGPPQEFSYQLSRDVLCGDDTAVLAIANAVVLSFTPSYGATWVDSLHALLNPDSSTEYEFWVLDGCNDSIFTALNLEVLSDSIALTTDGDSVCPGKSSWICASAGFLSYNWSDGETTQCIEVSAAGLYFVTGTDQGYCPAKSDSLIIWAYPPATVSVNASGDTLTASGAVTYQWVDNDNGSLIPGADSAVYIAPSPGSYSVQVTNEYGCSDTSGAVLVTGITNLIADSNVVIYPNPTTDAWQITISEIYLESEIQICDAQGRLIYKAKISNLNSEIALNNIASGVYLLRIISQNHDFVNKLVKL